MPVVLNVRNMQLRDALLAKLQEFYPGKYSDLSIYSAKKNS